MALLTVARNSRPERAVATSGLAGYVFRSRVMDLRNLIDGHLDLERLSSNLDQLGHFGRLWSVRQWTRRHMAVLWEALLDFRPTTLDDFVPPSVEPLTEVIHYGKNSLPIVSRFEKHFCRPHSTNGTAGGVLFGFNVQSLAALTGPGYFVARDTMREDGAADVAAVAFDYTMGATGKAASWPAVRPSSHCLGRWVYGGAVDIVRGLSRHVTIGRVRKKGAWEDTWFVLVREERQGP
jgi:hypothetical protein